MATRENNTANSPGARARVSIGVAAGVVVVLAMVAVLAARSSSHGLWSVLTGRAFVTAAAVFVGSLVVSVVLAAGLWRAGRPYRLARRTTWRGRDARETRGRDAFATVPLATVTNERGAAIVEFALVLPLLLMLGLLMAQSALLMTGIVVVHYAAHCAARTAAVVVPSAVIDAEGAVLAPRNVLTDGSDKYTRIRDAARWAVTPISCGSSLIPAADCDAVQRGIGAHWFSNNRPRPGWLGLYDSLPHRTQYAADHTRVTVRQVRYLTDGTMETLRRLPDDTAALTFAAGEDIVVDVSHVFYLGVPYAGRLLSSMFGDDGRALSEPSGGHGVVLRATSRLPNQGAQDFVDVEMFPPRP